ncbi:pyridoxal phosphate-dependent aminotransferase [Cloacibacillus porcorum]|uniref:pyridoxal phosphate-dependent aminotransferase n=1 Tax=Cloacibacillus porcorum TaxID=1197717 RepID=UPI0023F1319A|nr:pyridoxal phosphate-dependent aminotransferase [Cloacibacillus porcorum]MDD7649294.1 pyridoxal phosphate-dependent aminotransferase [Cloacibacillus porcorum]MDY4093504.1 pyridoxal phosphate-dependent aminotransferase [Cloacibacillus porcorum]
MKIVPSISKRYENISGGLTLELQKGSAGHGPEYFVREGYDYMAWADMFFPDPTTPKSVIDAMRKALDEDSVGHYNMEIGSDEIRELFATHFSKKFGRSVHPRRNILITSGTGPALTFTMMPFLSDDDEVLVPEPSYPNNYVNGKILGAKVVTVPLFREDNYQLKIEELEKVTTEKTKVLVLTNPNNPTGTVFRRECLEAVCEFVKRHNLVLISDEAFSDTVYDGIEFVHPCTLTDMWERTITLYSISKGYGLSGLRIGCIIADDGIMDIYQATAVNVMGVPNTIATAGAIAALKDDSILKYNYERNERRRRIAYDILKDIPGTKLKMSESGITTWLDVRGLGTSIEVATRIKDDAKIIISAGDPYGMHGVGFLRLVTSAYAKDEDAVMRLLKIKTVLFAIAKEKGLC